MQADLLYVGTFPRAYRSDPVDRAFGLYCLRTPPGGGALLPAGMHPMPRPGWLALHPQGTTLYVVHEVAEFEGEPGGALSAYRLDPHTGALQLLNRRRTDALPCHCRVDGRGEFVLVATFGGGSVHLFPLRADGALEPQADVQRHHGSSVHPVRQRAPHAHAVSLDPANRFVYVPDLGLDQVVVYELDRSAQRLRPLPQRNVQLAPGSGPRHMSFAADGRFAYLINEMGATVSVLACEAAGLREIQSVDLLPEGFTGLRSGAAIGIAPHGRFLYATTRSRTTSAEPPERGLDALVWFAIGADGRLQPAGRVPSGGEIARDFTFDASGEQLLVGHQGSGSIVTFALDPQLGTPQPIARTATPVPVCLRFVPSG